jgi:hypothetical protein
MSRRTSILLLIGAILGIGLIAILGSQYGRKRSSSNALRLSLGLPEGVNLQRNWHPFEQIAVSPDGQMLAFAATDASGQSSLWLRTLSSPEAQRIAQTDGALLPFWSPDSEFVGFWAGAKLKKVPRSGGVPEIIYGVPEIAQGAWGPDGTILFAKPVNSPIFRVPCHSPKFCPAAKSTACTLSSARQFAMTVLHVPLLPTVVRTTGPLLSFASHTALGELGTAAATGSTKTKTSSSKTPPDGQALLGPGPPVLGRLEKVAPDRHSRNGGALASCRISALLELDLEGEKTGRQKKTGEGNPESDLPNGGRKPNLGCSPHPRRTAHAGLRRFRAKHFPVDEASAQRSRTCPALAGLCSQSSRRDCRHGFLHCPDSHVPAAVLLLYY